MHASVVLLVNAIVCMYVSEGMTVHCKHLWVHVTVLHSGIILHCEERHARPDNLVSGFEAVCFYDEHRREFAQKPGRPVCTPLLYLCHF